jgi:hypothetical protein
LNDRDFIRIYVTCESLLEMGIKPTSEIVSRVLGWNTGKGWSGFPYWNEGHTELLEEVLELLCAKGDARHMTEMQTYRTHVSSRTFRIKGAPQVYGIRTRHYAVGN